MEKRITTVCGDIAPEAIGITSLHEHTFLDLRIAGEFMRNYFKNIPQSMLKFEMKNFAFLKTGVYLLSEECALTDDMDFLADEYGFFQADGGQTVVDCSPIGGRGDITKIKALSEKTGLNIVCATGIYTMTSRPAELLGKDEEFYYQYFKKEIEEGIDGTDIHPGILKAAIATMGPDGRIMDGEIAGVRAAARLSAETGMSMHIHTDPNVPAAAVVDVTKQAIVLGAKPDKVHICHMDNRLAAHTPVEAYLKNMETGRNINLDLQKELLELGVTIGLDTWGMSITNNGYFVTDDFERLKAAMQLIDAGYADQITFGDDFSSRLFGRNYGGYGCTRILEFALPMLKQHGYEKAVQKIFVENPARILAY